MGGTNKKLMAKPVDSIEFWKERIETADKESHSVYVTSQEDWNEINRVHSMIIEKNIPRNSNVLDAGCGYGRAVEFLTKMRYTGVDFSPDFIKKARKKYPEYTFKKASLKKLPFKKKEFDWAVCISMKRMIVDNLGLNEWVTMQQELKRVAEKILILEYTNPGKYEII